MRKIQYQIREEVGKVKSENEKIAIILVATIFVLLIMYVALSISNIKSGFELAELQIQKQELELKNDELKSIIKKLPVIKVEIEIKTETEIETEIFEISAYNTVEWQTDDSPCISASGKNICGRDDVIACPAKYKFGTQMQIIDKIYVCEDRMKKDGGIDISFDKDIAAAENWGRKTLAVKIIK